MEHLNAEQLARLVDEPPTDVEQNHLEACASCRAELAEYRDQTAALGGLPDLAPPRGDWMALETRLRSEGLIRDAGPLAQLPRTQIPAWMASAAAVVLFLGGLGTGATLTREARITAAADVVAARDVEGAALNVRQAEEAYVSAVARYRELLAQNGGEPDGSDPLSRFAALEHLVMVSQAAVRQAPGDPFLNGFLASAMAERDAALRLVSGRQDNWF